MPSDPQHRAISGYVDENCRWVFSVYDANDHEWRDVGAHRHEAVQYAANLPEPRPPSD